MNWSISLSIQALTADCGWSRQPVDDAINERIALAEAGDLAGFEHAEGLGWAVRRLHVSGP
jgi:hypothetical protein